MLAQACDNLRAIGEPFGAVKLGMRTSKDIQRLTDEVVMRLRPELRPFLIA